MSHLPGMGARCAPPKFRYYCQACAGGRIVKDGVCDKCDDVGLVMFDGGSIRALRPCEVQS